MKAKAKTIAKPPRDDHDDPAEMGEEEDLEEAEPIDDAEQPEPQTMKRPAANKKGKEKKEPKIKRTKAMSTQVYQFLCLYILSCPSSLA